MRVTLTIALALALSSSAGAQPLTFQDGVSPDPSYAGTRDVALYDGAGVYWSPGANHGGVRELRVRGGSLRNGVLIRWDVALLPPATPVYAATVYFTVSDSSGSSFEVYEALRAWSESQATWNSWRTGSAWTTAGAQGSGTDRGATTLGTVTGSGTAAVPLNAAGLTLVRGWVSGARPNNGLVVQDYASSASQMGWYSSEEATSSRRPRLRLTIDGGTIDFQQGVSPASTYSGCTDTVIGSGTDPQTLNSNGGSITVSAGHTGLVSFDLGSIEPGSVVSRVTLKATAYAGVGEVHVYEATAGWSEASATWRVANAPAAWGAPGARGTADRGQALLGRLGVDGGGTFEAELNATGVAAVQAWVDGARPNHGFQLVAADAGVPWIFLRDREYSGDAGQELQRPALVVELDEGSSGGGARPHGVGCGCRTDGGGALLVLSLGALLRLARARAAPVSIQIRGPALR